MAMIEIPVDTANPRVILSCDCDGVSYRLRFAWNNREAAWEMDILTDTEVALITGMKILPGWVPNRNYVVDNMPPGQFAVVDTEGTNVPPGRDEFGFGKRVKLYYDEATT